MNNLAVTEQRGTPMAAAEVRAQVNLIQEVMRSVMKEGTHYGKVPGCDNPTLLKPGAEKIMATFRLAADPEILNMSGQDEVRYQVKVRLIASSGVMVGAGVGECSTNEEKYKWRRAICEQEFQETPENRRREKWMKRWNKSRRQYEFEKVQQVRTEPADLANTVLKMAKKRALVDATLTTTAASDIFVQDIEDMPEEYMESVAEDAKAAQPIEEPPTVEEIELADRIKKAETAADLGAVWVDVNQYIKGAADFVRARLISAKDQRKKELGLQ